jgi:hypothetical protein
LEAANKNFIILKRKFDGDLSKALLAQSNSPLGYGSEFKPIETLELIFKNHPTWSRMKRVLKQGSKWPLQPLDEEDRVNSLTAMGGHDRPPFKELHAYAVSPPIFVRC